MLVCWHFKFCTFQNFHSRKLYVFFLIREIALFSWKHVVNEIIIFLSRLPDVSGEYCTANVQIAEVVYSHVQYIMWIVAFACHCAWNYFFIYSYRISAICSKPPALVVRRKRQLFVSDVII